jgi:membrane protease YdiL (CAAX protease family)
MKKMLAAGTLVFLFSLAGLAIGIIYRRRKKDSFPESDNKVANTSIKRAYVLLLAILYVIMALEIIEQIILAEVPGWSALTNSWPLTFAESGTNLVAVLVCIQLIVCKPLGLKVTEMLTKPGICSSSTMLAWTAGMFCFIKLLCQIYSLLTRLLIHAEPPYNNPVINRVWAIALYPSAPDIFFLWLYIGVFAPIAEEVVFRGVLYSVLRKRVGVMRACLLSGAIFSAAHLDPAAFLQTLFIGAGLAYVYERTRSLLPCIMMHGLWNSFEFFCTWSMI